MAPARGKGHCHTGLIQAEILVAAGLRPADLGCGRIVYCRVVSALDLLPHAPPMRLVEEVVDLVPGVSARARLTTRADAWFFQGHFPGFPVIPAVVLIELLAQTGGLAIGAAANGDAARSFSLRVAAVSAFKFPAAAGVGVQLDAVARVVGHIGGLHKVEGEVTADGRLIASGSLTLAEPR